MQRPKSGEPSPHHRVVGAPVVAADAAAAVSSTAAAVADAHPIPPSLFSPYAVPAADA